MYLLLSYFVISVLGSVLGVSQQSFAQTQSSTPNVYRAHDLPACIELLIQNETALKQFKVTKVEYETSKGFASLGNYPNIFFDGYIANSHSSEARSITGKALVQISQEFIVGPLLIRTYTCALRPERNLKDNVILELSYTAENGSTPIILKTGTFTKPSDDQKPLKELIREPNQ